MHREELNNDPRGQRFSRPFDWRLVVNQRIIRQQIVAGDQIQFVLNGVDQTRAIAVCTIATGLDESIGGSHVVPNGKPLRIATVTTCDDRDGTNE